MRRRAAEVATLLRLAGRFSVTAGRVRLEAELDHGLVAVRLRSHLEALTGHTCRLRLTALGGGRMRVQVDGAVAALLAQLGLLDLRGRLVGGLPPVLVRDPDAQVAAAVWRGAFLARGHLAEPARAAQARVWCPGPAPALALAGAARRLGVTAHCRPVSDGNGTADGTEMVVVSGETAVTELLSLIGAPAAAVAWRRHRRELPARAATVGPAAFDRENQRRSAAAAAAAAARAQRALGILGANAPPQLIAAGRLRVAHPEAALEQLGRLADPPLSKDAIAGRLRRLLRLGDTRAAAIGIPDTTHPDPTQPEGDRAR